MISRKGQRRREGVFLEAAAAADLSVAADMRKVATGAADAPTIAPIEQDALYNALAPHHLCRDDDRRRPRPQCARRRRRRR
jgi:hypothetical protein